jgi:hypothetical protein
MRRSAARADRPARGELGVRVKELVGSAERFRTGVRYSTANDWGDRLALSEGGGARLGRRGQLPAPPP